MSNFTPSIENMPPDKVMRKEPFRRLRPSSDITALDNGLQEKASAISGDKEFWYPTYADFMREQEITAHRIMSPVWYPDIIGFDEEKKRQFCRKVARVTTNLPEVFASQRTSMLTGDHVDLKLVSGGSSKKNQELLAEYMEGWEYKDIETAVYELIWNSAIVCDSAIVFYLDNKKVGWKSLCYPKGDIIYPHYNEFGRLCLFGRKYSAWDGDGETEYLEVWDDKKYVRYKLSKETKKGVNNYVVETSGEHGFPRCPVAYFRAKDTVAGPAMNLLDNFDLAMSQLCENNKAYALRIFYALGADVDVTASVDGRPMQITSTDSNSKVGFLEPAEASGSYELQLKQLIKSAYQAAHCTEPTELKSGADISSLTVQMLSKESYHQALLDAKQLQPALNDIVELFKYGYAIELKKDSEYSNLHIKGTINPYIMRSEVEEVNNLSILKAAGAIPTKAAANEAAKLGYGTPRNWDEILQEQHDELVGQSNEPTASANPVSESRKKQNDK